MEKRTRARRIVTTLIAALLMVTMTTSAAYAQSSALTKIDVSVSSKYAIAVDLTNNKVLYSKNSTKRVRPASIIKVMTALIVLENSSNMSKTATVNKADVKKFKGTGEDPFKLVAGEKASRTSLLYVAMYQSDAVACYTLARSVSGSVSSFTAKMNAKAKALGMKNTHFGDPTGIDMKNTYTTMSDFAKLMKYAVNNEAFMKIFQGTSYTYSKTNKRTKSRTVTNAAIARKGSSSLIDGGKLGWTKLARKTIVATATINETQYLFVGAYASPTSKNNYPNISDANRVFNKIQSLVSN
jgi:D-alanyl-D-alanine carboxypeptidase